jgi:hypothetical protein
MAYITGKIPQGNCGAVVYDENGHHICSPIPDQPGKDPRAVNHVNFYAKVVGEPGETVHLDIAWPMFDEELCGWRKYKSKPFFYNAHRCVYISTDQIHWSRYENVVVDKERWLLQLTLTLTEATCFVSVNYYYTIPMLELLRNELCRSPWAQELTIGHSRDGQPLRLFRVTDEAVPAEEKRSIYLQAGQHCCEFGGMHLADRMLRYLCSDTAEAVLLRRKYVFHILPVVSVADWSDGYTDELLADSNTVWDTLSTTESKAIDSYLRSLSQTPALLIDCHNAQEHSFLICSENLSEKRVAQLHRFNELVCTLCDFGEINRCQFPDHEKYANFKQYALQKFGYGVTMELSRFSFYDRQKQANQPLSHESFLRLGSQLPHAIDAFVSELTEW